MYENAKYLLRKGPFLYNVRSLVWNTFLGGWEAVEGYILDGKNF